MWIKDALNLPWLLDLEPHFAKQQKKVLNISTALTAASEVMNFSLGDLYHSLT